VSFAPLDIVFTILIFIIVVRAALHGFVEEVFGIAWLVLGLMFAISFYRPGAAFVRTKVLNDVKILPEVLAFIVLFLIVFVVVKIITFILKDIVQKIKLGGLDHFLGLLFGILEGLLAVAVVIFIINIQPLFDKNDVLKDSIYNQFLSANVKAVQDIIVKPNGSPPIPEDMDEMGRK
jgi:membrane protein required for colicin V production